MPFDFGVDFGSFDFAADVFSAGDVTSLVDSFGDEFLSGIGLDADSLSSFADAPISDLADLDAWTQVGSFAGDADWYDAFGSGVIDAAENVDVDAFFESTREAAAEAFDLTVSPTEFDVIRELPFTEQVKAIASQVSQDFTGFVKNAQSALQVYQKFAPVVNLASSAFGIPNPVNQVIQPISQAVGIAGAAAGVTGAAATGNARAALTNPAVVSTAYYALGGGATPVGQGIATGVSIYNTAERIGSTLPPVNQPGSVVATNGVVGGVFRELSDAETLELERRNLNPLFVNSLVDPGINQSQNYNTAVQTRDSLTPVVENLQIRVDEARELISQENENIIRYQNELDNPDLTNEERAALEANIQVSYDYIARSQQVIDNNEPLIISTSEEIARAQQVIASTNLSTTTSPAPVNAIGATSQYTSAYDPETGTWSVFDNLNSTTVRTGLTEQQAILAEQDLNITSGVTLSAVATPVNLGTVTATDLDLAVDPGPFAEGSSARNLVAEARAQQSARAVRNNKAESSDWRVRLRLAPNSTYLYNAPGNPGDPASGPGIMAPLAKTDGVIFPYTPAIDTAYKANYEAYDLTHSNYRGYFYKGSYVDAVNIRAQFTAQDTNEANYLLAVIHFFRSATKMFYGKDQQRGAPPPLVYLSGYGDYQFNEHPSVISQFNYTLPPDVDYIRAQNALDVNTNALGNRIRNPIANNPLSYTVNRLLNSNLLPGALDFRPNISNNLPLGSPTYVPTKMEISITLLPIQSRQQVSKNFSVKTFAAGNLLKGGYW